MDVGLVRGTPRRREPVLRAAQPAGPVRRAQLRRWRADPAQGDQGRLAPVRPQLLPALPARGAPGAGGRHVDVAHRLPLRDQAVTALASGSTASSRWAGYVARGAVRT